MFENKLPDIFQEISNCLSYITSEHIEIFSDYIHRAEKIVTIGAGRMGYSLRSFSMRLSHIGYNAYHIGDTNLPRIGKNDLVIVGSGSGETRTIVELTRIAYENGATVISITHEPLSQIAKMSKFVMPLNKILSEQLMKSVYEQSTFILYDMICYDIVHKYRKLDVRYVEQNHSVLE